MRIRNFENINRLGQRLSEGLGKITKYTVKAVGSLVCVFMTEEEVNDYDSAVKSDTGLFGRYFNHLLNNGIYIAPSQFEAMLFPTPIQTKILMKHWRR